MLTPEEKKRLAAGIKKLVADCRRGRVELIADSLTNFAAGVNFRGCAMGTLCERVFGSPFAYHDKRVSGLPGVSEIVSANNNASAKDRAAAVVAPLLALRDALLEAE